MVGDHISSNLSLSKQPQIFDPYSTPAGGGVLESNPQPFSTSIASNPPTNKPHKDLKIAIATLILIAIIAIVIVVVNNDNGTQNYDSQNNIDTKTNFLKFANYTLFGNDVANPIVESYDPNHNYYLTSGQTQDEQIAIFTTVNAKWNDFLSAYTKSQSSDNALRDIINDEQQIWDLMKVVYIKTPLSSTNILSIYRESGKDGAISETNSYYIFSAAESNQYVNEFKAYHQSWAQSYINLLELYDENYCITQENINYFCVREIQDEDTISAINKEKDSATETYAWMNRYYHLDSSYVVNIFSIANILGGANE